MTIGPVNNEGVSVFSRRRVCRRGFWPRVGVELSKYDFGFSISFELAHYYDGVVELIIRPIAELVLEGRFNVGPVCETIVEFDAEVEFSQAKLVRHDHRFRDEF